MSSLDTLKYSHKPVAMAQYGIITYIKCLDTADYYPQRGRRSDGCTSTITHDIKNIVTRLTNKAVSPGRLCSMCNLNDIEDEFHLTLRCPAYNDLRRKNTLNKDIAQDHLFSNYYNYYKLLQ